ncbi:MAG: J domain-containing protein, partial [Myxococcota bacterium]
MSAERRPLTSEEEGRIRALSRARTDGTLYDVLGLRSDATGEEIEAAYYELARQWHPDRFYSRDTGELGSAIEENFVAATRAFRTLRDPLKRQAYHRELGIQG